MSKDFDRLANNAHKMPADYLLHLSDEELEEYGRINSGSPRAIELRKHAWALKVHDERVASGAHQAERDYENEWARKQKELLRKEMSGPLEKAPIRFDTIKGEWVFQ